MKPLFLVSALVFAAGISSTSSVAAQSPAELVNPLVGTSAEGQTFPAVGLPFGMTQWTPETRATEQKGLAPYYFADPYILGFRGSHFLSGSATQDYGSFQLLAGHATPNWAGEPPASRYTHISEHAHPYLYEVNLPGLGVAVSITGTTRCGLMAFRFAEAGPAWISVQNNARSGDGSTSVDPARGEISGRNQARRIYAGSGKLAGFSGFVVVQFDHPFRVGGGWSGRQMTPDTTSQDATANSSGIWVAFDVKAGETVQARIGTSFVSIDEARRNLQTEIPNWDFAAVQAASKAAWDKTLGAVELDAPLTDRRIFYTALYHASQLPRPASDVSGTYPRFAGKDQVETAKGFAYYDDFSLWDTFRALHPLLTLLDPARETDMVRSLIAKGVQGGFLPIFPAWNSYTSEMVGDHAVAVIGDAWLKGIRGFDIEQAYALMRRNATESPASADDYRDGRGRRALDSYLKYGFVPLEDPVADAFHKNEQVSRTLEYAYDDFVLSRLAQSLHKSADAALFTGRAANFRNVIDPDTGFARGRHADGTWITPFDPAKPASYITEGLPFQYTFFVPQDIPALIKLEHGPAAFGARLDELFARKLYDHGNEPSHQIAYLYDYAGLAWKSQQHIAEIQKAWYADLPGGLAGNDDAGQMSAWHVLSALGFYPVTPGIPAYAIGTPRFPVATLHLANGKVFRIVAHGAAPDAPYIQSATLNGHPLERFWLTHAEIMAGGELVFTLSSHPNPAWPKDTNAPR